VRHSPHRLTRLGRIGWPNVTGLVTPWVTQGQGLLVPSWLQTSESRDDCRVCVRTKVVTVIIVGAESGAG
jgi:hypothetical protein